MPLALTDSELDIIMRAAAPIARGDRDAFLQDVANALASCSDVGPGTIYQVCRDLQRRHYSYPLVTEVGGAPARRRSVSDER